MRIGPLDSAKRVVLIAEAGINHEGNIDLALALVDEAARAGADIIKFQTYKTDQLVLPRETARVAQRRRFELSFDQFKRIAARAAAAGITFLSTAFDEESLAFLAPLMPAFKISSVDFTNERLIAKALEFRKPLLMSCGMSDDAAIKRTLGFVEARAGAAFLKESVTLLHCVSSYPAPYDQLNLRSIPYLAQRYGLEVGYSDHAAGNAASLAAVALGARVIEKHFTLDKSMSGVRDHQLSADPSDIRQLAEGIRQIEPALGVPGKRIADAEQASVRAMRRGLVAASAIQPGQALTAENVLILLPAEGIPSDQYFESLGKPANRAIEAGEPIHHADLGQG